MELPLEAPVMTLSNAILFPQSMLPLFIFEPRYRRMLADSLASHRTFVVAMQKPGRKRETPSVVGGLGLIRAAVTNADGSSHLILQGLERVNLHETVKYKPYRLQRIEPVYTTGQENENIASLATKLLDLVTKRMKQGIDFPVQMMGGFAHEPMDSPAMMPMKQVLEYLRSVQDPSQLVDLISGTLLPTPVERQLILETQNLEERLNLLVRFLSSDIKYRSKKNPS